MPDKKPQSRYAATKPTTPPTIDPAVTINAPPIAMHINIPKKIASTNAAGKASDDSPDV